MVAVSYSIHYNALMRNVTDIVTKCDNFFKKFNSYYKMKQCYNKIQKVITKYVSAISSGPNNLCLSSLLNSAAGVSKDLGLVG